jgi:hypothetical protein
MATTKGRKFPDRSDWMLHTIHQVFGLDYVDLPGGR